MTKFKQLFLIALLLLSGCNAFRNHSKQNLEAGYFFQKSPSKERVYAFPTDTTIDIYSISENSPKQMLSLPVISFKKLPEVKLSQYSFDLDFLTFPIKFRPATSGIPAQLNSNVNGALYLGFRTDRFKINYDFTPVHFYHRSVFHLGFSVGAFAGIGNSYISSSLVSQNSTSEYDALVFSKGVAAIIGINRFTIGITLGFDQLLDENKTVWIYQNKPWLGIGFGLNLN